MAAATDVCFYLSPCVILLDKGEGGGDTVIKSIDHQLWSNSQFNLTMTTDDD